MTFRNYLDPIMIVFLKRTSKALYEFFGAKYAIVNGNDPLFNIIEMLARHEDKYFNWNCNRVLDRTSFILKSIRLERYDFIRRLGIVFDCEACFQFFRVFKSISWLTNMPKDLFQSRIQCIIQLTELYDKSQYKGYHLSLEPLNKIKSRTTRHRLSNIITKYNQIIDEFQGITPRSKVPNPIIKFVRSFIA
jgi:hypothetical protein